MADDTLFPGTPSGETVVDYLGRPVPVSFAGQPALPVGGAAVGAPTAPTSPGGMGTAASGVIGVLGSSTLTGTAPSKQQDQSGVMTALGALEQGKKLSDIAEKVFETPVGPGIGSQVGAFSEFGGPGVADFSATQPVIGDIMAAPSSAPVMAAGEGAFSAIPSEVTAGVEAGVAESPGFLASASQAVSDFATAAAPFAAFGGGIFQAVTSDTPAGKAFGAAEAAAAPLLFVNPVVGGIVEGILGLGGFLSGLFGGGPSKRELEQRQAERVAAGDISALSSRLHAGGSPEQILAALETPSADFSSIAERNPVRSFLEMPSEVAKEIGLPVLAPQDVPGEFTYLDPFTGTLAPHATHGRGEILQYGPGGQGIDRFRNAVQVPWTALSPQQFQAFLTRYAADPATVGQYVRGSGDVGYLPQGEAVAEASQAQNLTIDALNRLVATMGPTPGAVGGPPPSMAAPTTEAVAPAAPRRQTNSDAAGAITAGMSPGGGGLTELAEMLPV